MATINIGSLSFTHKGDYASGTAYVKNDVVYYSTNGNAYVAKTSTTGNAPTSTAHWDLFASGSGGIWNAGLSLGSAGQVVKVNSGGSALEFGTLSSDYVLISDTSVSNATQIQVDVFSATYKFYKVFILGCYGTSNGYGTQLRLNSSAGTVQTASYYCGVNDGGYYNNTGSSGQQINGTFNDNHWKISNISNNSNETSDHEFTFANPYDASINTSFIGTGGGFEANHAYSRHSHGVYKNAEQNTGFTFYATTGNIYAPIIKVYGLK